VQIFAAFPLKWVTKILKLARREKGFYAHPESIRSENIKLQECAVIAIYFARAQSQGAALRMAARGWGALAYLTEKIAEYLPLSADLSYIRARILRQSNFNEYIIIDNKVGDDHRSCTENPKAHALSGQWPFG
jgi:hypothetical protein